MSVGCAMRTMNQLLATSFRCARRTLHCFIELIRTSLATKITTGTDHDNIHNSDYVSRINQGKIDQLPEIAESPSNT